MNTPRKKPTPRIAAPPVYRPGPKPVVLQAKPALPGKLKPAAQPNIKRTPVAPPVYRAQPATKVTQAKISTLHNKPWAGSRTIQRAEMPVVEQVEPPPPEEKGQDRKQKQASSMVWNEFVPVTAPAPKHVLETMKLSDVNVGRLVSVVTKAVMTDAVSAIGAHVKANGWKSGGGITVEWIENEKCYKVTYKGNQWKTHVGSGQLWPYCGPNIFSPSLAPEQVPVETLKTYIKNWKSKKQAPDKYMNMSGQ